MPVSYVPVGAGRAPAAAPTQDEPGGRARTWHFGTDSRIAPVKVGNAGAEILDDLSVQCNGARGNPGGRIAPAAQNARWLRRRARIRRDRDHAVAEDFGRALGRSRPAAKAITFEGRYFRRDIGWSEEEPGPLGDSHGWEAGQARQAERDEGTQARQPTRRSRRLRRPADHEDGERTAPSYTANGTRPHPGLY